MCMSWGEIPVPGLCYRICQESQRPQGGLAPPCLSHLCFYKVSISVLYVHFLEPPPASLRFWVCTGKTDVLTGCVLSGMTWLFLFPVCRNLKLVTFWESFFFFSLHPISWTSVCGYFEAWALGDVPWGPTHWLSNEETVVCFHRENQVYHLLELQKEP